MPTEDAWPWLVVPSSMDRDEAMALLPEGYGTVGFQASGVDFPTEGCWEVTGAVGDATLTFVMFVQRA